MVRCVLIWAGLAGGVLLPSLVADEPAAEALSKPGVTIRCEGSYSQHLQGFCIDDREAIYWSFTDVLAKTDREGKLLKKIPVEDHHGDLCFHDGKVYVAVNLGEFNEPEGAANSWVFVYDAGTLEELSRHETPQVVHGAGGIAFDGERFLVVGGLPPEAKENYLYEYDASFKFRKRHALASGYTLKGIQTAAFADDHWWFGCYGSPPILLKADRALNLVGKWETDASLGIVGIPEGGFLVARGVREKGSGHSGSLVHAVADFETGLKAVESR